jgi:ABC-type Mn2+/Zn2+ transport system ATPase subunit
MLEAPVGHLSGGQFQRGLIGFAIIGKPNVLLLDEPTASIDEPGEEHIYELIHRLQDQYDLAVIVVTHDLSFVYRYATKMLCLNKQGCVSGRQRNRLPRRSSIIYMARHSAITITITVSKSQRISRTASAWRGPHCIQLSSRF